MASALVAIDQSSISRDLIHYAFQFARMEKIDHLDFIHVTPEKEKPMIISDPDHPADLPEVESIQIRDELFSLLTSAVRNPEQPEITFDLIVNTGTPYEEIILQADKGDYDFILIGHRGMSNVKRFFIGSVAAKVVRHAPCSILVFHPQEKGSL